MKAVLWEEAKGKLRAMLAAEGQRQTSESHTDEKFMRYTRMASEVERFITRFEEAEFHE